MVRDTVADVLWRWDRVGIDAGLGLRDGTFRASGDLGAAPVTIQLAGVRWVSDASVSGTLTVSSQGKVTGSLDVSIPTGHATLAVKLDLYRPRSLLEITGNIRGRAIDILTTPPAPL
jgi:hypothetical protein